MTPEPPVSAPLFEDVYADTLSHILNCLSELSDCAFIIGGDFNCEFKSDEGAVWNVLCYVMSE